MKSITMKNQTEYIGKPSSKKELEKANIVLDSYNHKSGSSFDLYHWPVNSNGVFLGFAEVKQFNSIASAEKALGKHALGNINRQVVSDAINDYRTLNGKSDAERR